MSEKIHKVKRFEQGVQECVQSSAAQLLDWYGIEKTLEDIKSDVPVYIGADGKPVGTSLGHIATYFLGLGFDVNMNLFDVQIFDPSWSGLSNDVMIQKLKDRRKHIKHGYYNDNIIDVIFDGHSQFLQKGGTVDLGDLDTSKIKSMLDKNPLYAVVNYNVLHQLPRYIFEGDKPEQNSIKGAPTTHAIVISGYRNNEFLIVDPDYEHGGEIWISEPRLVTSLLTAQHDLDSMILNLKK